MKIGWIKYLNTLPFDFEKTGLKLDFYYSLVKGVPSQINNFLSKGIVDVGFISSAHYIKNYKKYLILPELSISSLNRVKSVIILSDTPIEKINRIYLTEESETSKLLTKVIFKVFLKKDINYLDLKDENIKDKEAVLLIGDKAINYLNEKNYRYDLSEIWYRKTGLPFVFALWCVRKEYYLKNKEKVIKLQGILKKSKNIFFEKPEKYINDSFSIEYLKNLDYCFSEEHLKSLKLFSEYLYQMRLIEEKPVFNFVEVT
ncbi:chorismate dehydratase [Persephonella hydrogeniphila]|uniref:Chorismate dehydratase n=1 Tax=Persephonella hydrogeniphila TaxID=198703 RepID=A0A285N249_9AQUI|nr:menaquinone biosynthesis protein [Persephonella hydrogeniphila]SNZ03522.1 chorismate dehydratase [Persephonella hydrogeniphila]